MDTRSETDAALIQRLQKGDDQAFSVLYARYFERLYRYAYKRTTDAQAAQDIVQDVFMSLWKNRQRSEIKDPDRYLATAVKFLSINFITRNRLSPLSPEQMTEAGAGITSEDLSHNRLLLELVRQETARLPKKCRLVFEYSRQQGLSVKEIAATLDMSPAAVEKQLERALTRLRNKLKRFTTFLPPL